MIVNLSFKYNKNHYYIDIDYYRQVARFYGLKIYYTVAINFICSWFSHPFSYLPGDTRQNIYKDH